MMNKKIIGIFIVTLLITTIFPVTGINNSSDIKIRILNKNETKTGEVQMFSTRDIQVDADGNAVIIYDINLPDSPLSGIYRDFFGIENPVKGQEYEIPESKSVTPVIEFGEGVKDHSLLGDVNADGIVNFRDIIPILQAFFSKTGDSRYNSDADLDGNGEIDFQDFIIGIQNYGKKRQPIEPDIQPVKEPFIQGMVDEMQIPLGFPEVIPLGFGEIIPLGEDDATSIMVEFNSPQLAYYDYEQECLKIQAGPWYETASEICWEFLMTKILYLQMMLESFAGEDVSFYSNSITTFNLPSGSNILNAQDLNEMSWSLDFSDGTIIEATLTVSDDKIILNEEMYVSTNDIIIPELEDYSYQRFDIMYLGTPANSVSTSSDAVLENKKPFSPELNYLGFSWEWGFGRTLGTVHIKFKDGTTVADLWAYASVWGKLHCGWNFNWFGLLENYESYFEGNIDFWITGELTTTGSFKKIWKIEVYHLSWPVFFVVGTIPVEVTVDFSITSAIDFTVNSESHFKLGANVKASSLKGGIHWNVWGGWNPIYNLPTLSFNKNGPTISMTADAYICPSAEFKLAGWVYHVAGPYIKFKPAAATTITYPARGYTTDLLFEIIGGAEFAGWLSGLLGLPRYETTLYSKVIKTWTGTW